jgi:hypothetical protein
LERLGLEAAARGNLETSHDLLGRSLHHYERALACGDFRRYFGPLAVPLAAAQNALTLGHPERAVKLLEGWLEPETPPGGAHGAMLPGYIEKGGRFGVFGGHVHFYKVQELTHARLTCAQAWCALYADAQSREAALEALAHARTWITRAMELSDPPPLWVSAWRRTLFPWPAPQQPQDQASAPPTWTNSDPVRLGPLLDALQKEIATDPEWQAVLRLPVGEPRREAAEWALLAKALQFNALQTQDPRLRREAALKADWAAREAHRLAPDWPVAARLLGA